MSKGSIEKRNGGYRVRIEIGIDPLTGKRNRLQKQFAYKKHAEQFLHQMISQVDQGKVLGKGKGLTVRAFFEDWLKTAVKPQVKQLTYEGYSNKLKVHFLPLLGNFPLKDLHQDHLSKIYADMQVKGLSPTSALHLHRVIHAGLEYAVNNAEVLAQNVAKKAVKPRNVRKEAKILTIEQLHQVFEASQGSEYHPIFLLLAYTGMRRSEVLGLRLKDINFESGTLSVVQGLKQSTAPGSGVFAEDTKTKRSTRAIDISPTVINALRGIRERIEANAAILGVNPSPEMLIFGDPVTGQPLKPNTVSKVWKKLRRKLGLPEVKLKDLRHTHASALIAAGVHVKVISERLGHSNIGITMDTYGHLMPGASRQAADKFEAMMQAGPIRDPEHQV